MSEWQPIETAPEDGTRVLLIAENRSSAGPKYFLRPFVGYWRGSNFGWALDVPDPEKYLTNYHPPTHWMPLPELPK